MTCRTILLLISALLFSTPLYADMTAANYELNRGNFKAAAKEFTRLAESGDVHAQSYLGYMYYVGQGVTRDYTEAVRWYRKAAEKGDRDAQYNLAVAYAFGQGVKKDLQQAVKWYLKAAEQGHAAAEYSLGLSYANGEGAKQNIETAKQWFSKAADQGYADAQKALDILRKQEATAAAKHDSDNSADTKNKEELLNMDGLEPSHPGAEMPAKILQEHPPAAVADADTAAVTGDTAVQAKTLEQEASTAGLDDGTGQPATDVKQDVTPEFKSLDGSAVGSTVPAGAVSMDETKNTGEEGTGSFLNRLFGRQKTGVEKGSPEAAGMTGADEDNRAAQNTRSSMIDNTGRDGEQGLLNHLLGNADGITAEKDAGPGKNNGSGKTGIDPSLYKRGMAALANKNYRDAATLFHGAATQGDPGSQFQLGALFYQGLGVTRDYNEAERWYQRSADNGNADAQYSLGNMYLMGKGVEQNDQKAMYWYKKAANQGHDSARQNLEKLKEIVSKADEKPELAEGKASETAAGGSGSEKEQPKQGFFSRLFGKEKPKAGEQIASGATTQDTGKVTAGTSGRKTDKKPSFMSKEGGGLLGHLFGISQDDEKNGSKSIPANDEQDESTSTATDPAQGSDAEEQQAAANTREGRKDKPSIMSKEGGGLFGYLFGWGTQEDKPGHSEQGNSSNTSKASTQSAGSNDDSAAQ